jgi:poly(A) polymerase
MATPAPKSTALWVVRRLRRAGHQAFFAGGCVRDMLLGRPTEDYDVATDATPQEVKALFPQVLLVGAKFGVAMVLRDHRKVEVATFRSDLAYVDGRRPEGVRFATAREDALRRDFTINGMFYDPLAREVIDYVGGRLDLERRAIRTIGEPGDRFAEDYLRMLRAVRFAVALGFELDARAADAIRREAPSIERISGERVFEELWKMLKRPSAADAMKTLADVGLAGHVLPELLTDAGLWDRALRRVEAVARRKDPALTLAALALDWPAPAIAAFVRRGGQSNELAGTLAWLAARRDDWRSAGEMDLAGFKRLIANPAFASLRRLWEVEERLETGAVRATARVLRRARFIPPEKIAPPPLITGRDLKTMGLAQGRRLGEVLRRLYEAQLNEEIATADEGMAMAKTLIGE